MRPHQRAPRLLSNERARQMPEKGKGPIPQVSGLQPPARQTGKNAGNFKSHGQLWLLQSEHRQSVIFSLCETIGLWSNSRASSKGSSLDALHATEG